MDETTKDRDQEWPLVTFALFAYNQEKYIQEAVEGALAQDYPNLEIIVSDDTSSDGTWAAIESIVAAYNGPHRVVTRRNSRNFGIAAHVNLVLDLAAGEMVVMAAGDDISSSHRVSRIVDAWIREGRPEAALHSSSRIIGADGRALGRLHRGRAADANEATLEAFVSNGFRALIQGATAAYTINLYRSLGPLISEVEDVPLTFRALLMGRLIYIDEALVDYRTGVGNTARGLVRSDRKHVRWFLQAWLAGISCYRHDYYSHCSNVGAPPDDKILAAFDGVERSYRAALGMASSGIIENLRGLFALPVPGGIRDRLYVAAVYFGLRK